jgi:hypothetical protein
MYATNQTWLFKTNIITILESSRLGYDTRYRYYKKQFPDTGIQQLARMICDPIEYYDKDWPDYLANKDPHKTEAEAIVDFVLIRDYQFQREAEVAIYCYDEAGFGSGINTMRFINAGKPLLGFFNSRIKERGINISNILQLEAVYPHLVTLVEYESNADIADRVVDWVKKISKHK